MPRPRKRFGQHWLKDTAVHRAMVAAAGLSKNSTKTDQPDLVDPEHLITPPLPVLEIGPGTGRLTQYLLKTGSPVLAVELDRDLCRLLGKRFGDQPHFHLVEADFLRMEIPPNVETIVGNIPYNITSPILHKVLGSPHQPVTRYRCIVLLVQKELAERLQARPNTKAYGSMSIRTQYLAECEILRAVPRSSFTPAPKVDSAIIRLRPRPYPLVPQDPKWFGQIVQQGFSTRRKTLANTVQSLVDKSEIVRCLTAQGLDPAVRAENLSLDQWIALSDQLLPHRLQPAQVASSPSEQQETDWTEIDQPESQVERDALDSAATIDLEDVREVVI
ncbi:MAG: ribosomal RNA small subunit methyltransferase A [Synechococcaceae cyanobacterium SM2_3_2]|nr:ribosomal RNA small subunit methyltransferase A [Synechococcaceae cyanobacterium SM2_3_2]